MSAMTATEKVNMSLDDIIKLNKKEPPKTKGKPKGPALKKTVNAGVKGAASKQRRPSIKGKPATPAAKGVPALVKVAKVVGTNAAKRTATVNQRRGLNPTGKATKKDVNAAVKKAVNKSVAAPAAGLKICFKPSELASTTDKIVSQQIRAVLSRQTVGQNRSKNTDNSNSNPTTPAPIKKLERAVTQKYNMHSLRQLQQLESELPEKLGKIFNCEADEVSVEIDLLDIHNSLPKGQPRRAAVEELLKDAPADKQEEVKKFIDDLMLAIDDIDSIETKPHHT